MISTCLKKLFSCINHTKLACPGSLQDHSTMLQQFSPLLVESRKYFSCRNSSQYYQVMVTQLLKLCGVDCLPWFMLCLVFHSVLFSSIPSVRAGICLNFSSWFVIFSCWRWKVEQIFLDDHWQNQKRSQRQSKRNNWGWYFLFKPKHIYYCPGWSDHGGHVSVLHNMDHRSQCLLLLWKMGVLRLSVLLFCNIDYNW